jgi:hypothetical protein
MWALNFYFFGVYGTRQLIPPGPVPTAHFFFGIGQYFKILGLDGIWKNTLYWIGQYFKYVTY